MSETRVWVGCLACYNAGYLIGEWFDASEAPTEVDEFNTALQVRVRAIELGREGGAENWATEHLTDAHEELWVMDHEGFHGLLTGECSPMTARELAEQLDAVDEPEAFALYVADHMGRDYAAADWNAARSQFEDAWCGYWDSEADYAMELAEDMGALSVPAEDSYGMRSNRRDLSSEWPFSCIDWDRAWNELRIGGDCSSTYVDGQGYAIFRSV